MATAVVFGCTGAVGSKILDALVDSDCFNSITTISRRLPPAQSCKLEAIQEPDVSQWGSIVAHTTPTPDVVFNAVGTTRATAGGIHNQWKIDHDLCIENARAAKHAGVHTYVFISSAGTRGYISGRVPYSQMKAGVEDAIAECDFAQAIILRPGMILGEREKPQAPMAEWIFSHLHMISQGLQDSMAQHQSVIGRAAVAAAQMAQQGKAPSRYWILGQADIVRLGRDDGNE